MAKRNTTDSGMPIRQPGKSLDAAGEREQLICGHLEQRADQSYVCVKNPGHLGEHTPTPVTTEAVKRLAERYGRPDDTDQTVVLGNAEVAGPRVYTATELDRGIDTDDLTAAASPRDGETTDPPATPSDGSTLEPRVTAGSGGGAGRSQVLSSARTNPTVRPDASEAVLGAAMGVIVPAGDPAYAITHAEESARVLVLGAAFGSMVQAIADGRLVDDDDLVTVYRKVRQMGATHGIDLDDEGGIVSELKRRVAKIESTTLGYEDHGIFTIYLHVSYGGGLHQGVGGYALDEYQGERGKGRRVGTAYGMEFITRVMRACGVNRWEDIPGRTVYVLTDESRPAGFGGEAAGIEPLETERGERFLFKDLRIDLDDEGAS